MIYLTLTNLEYEYQLFPTIEQPTSTPLRPRMNFVTLSTSNFRSLCQIYHSPCRIGLPPINRTTASTQARVMNWDESCRQVQTWYKAYFPL